MFSPAGDGVSYGSFGSDPMSRNKRRAPTLLVAALVSAAADADGNVYGAGVGPRALKKYLKK